MSAAPGRHERPLRDAAGLAAVYCLFAVAAILLARQPGSVASVWFANATGIALLAHRAHARWPALLAAAACANVAAHWMVGDTLALSLSFFPASLLEIAVGAWLLQRSGPVERFAEDTGQLLRVLLAGALLPQLLGATVSALTLQLLGLQRFALAWDDLYISQRGGGAPAHAVGHVGGVELGHG